MSIALEAKVTALEKRIDELENSLRVTQMALAGSRQRIADLEATAARKPGPKPKDSNG